jgi:hypothetical protein
MLSDRVFSHLLKSVFRLANRHLAALVLAAFAPFLASHFLVLTARTMGWPDRLVLDALHGFFVLAYLGAVIRIGASDGTDASLGSARLGFAVPRIHGLSFEGMVSLVAFLVIICLPVWLLQYPVTHAIEAFAVMRSPAWTAVPSVMVPEFFLTAFIGLAIAALMAKTSDATKP